MPQEDDNVYHEISQRGLRIQRLEDINAELLAALEGLLIAYITELSPEQRRACKGEKSTEDIDGNVREARAAIAKVKP